MPSRRAAGRGRPRRRRAGNRRRAVIPRAPQLGVATLRRAYNYGTLARGASDQSFQIGVVPPNLPDWTNLTAVWKRFRVMSVQLVFMFAGEFDTTPQMPTFVVAHDVMSVGPPASFAEATSQKGHRLIPLNAGTNMGRFTFVPQVWTSTSFTLTVPAPRAYLPLTGGASFTSVVGWGHNYRDVPNGGSPPVNVLVDITVEFSYPQ